MVQSLVQALFLELQKGLGARRSHRQKITSWRRPFHVDPSLIPPDKKARNVKKKPPKTTKEDKPAQLSSPPKKHLQPAIDST